ncbi:MULTISPECIES: isocitrate lyase/PEP mutase family protein [Paraburkholderia]|uniref:2-Methylisocitrate lyase, PEP mutase family n=1 Tax=Paraburkholderia terricola TaxID=169427 RepID=A0A1M6RFB0_9BURK|nr:MULTISPECIES: isocitrate lyase/phosphoenolpyruvate mutase family protein [Paraburkholderia]AXE96364.1 isocitrate lyase/phosphoenolpyruvate mutase family protein [Paraburkholderia terricola]ORC45362.1 2-methylisocitrate lyase [Burkholderia sp. A27]SDO99682.1 2-Methylisocitrate lyase, PEP mutase family [Paraburkholderia sediminicola]SHK31047.1 2-Methylisocitrate lyase, PEP mutase family [Paraburkholderia terricola]
MTTQSEKAQLFRSYHTAGEAFIIPNPWDIGSARLLALAGFKALATSSAGYAFSRGLPDNAIGRAQMMVHLGEIAGATALPVSADLENGFGDAPEDCAETIAQAAAAGVVGGSIEDATGRADEPVYPFEAAVERVRAAVVAARALPFPFTLTARSENYLVGRPDLDDTIRRLQAYQQAGADVLYAPGLKTREEIAAVVGALERPVNVLMGLQGVLLSFDELRALGVRRVSVGGSLARAALGAFLRAAHEMRDHGTFSYTKDAVSGNEINQLFSTAARKWQKPG